MFDRYAAFIIPSYIATFVVMAALIVWIMIVYRARQKEIADLEAKGIRRGSIGAGASGNAGATDER